MKALRISGDLKIGVIGYRESIYDREQAADLLQTTLTAYRESNPLSTIVIVAGLTAAGIAGQAYELARHYGYRTVGIACKKILELELKLELFPCNEAILVGNEWGEESDLFLSYCDAFIRIGGDQSTLALSIAARKRGKYILDCALPRL